MSQENVETLLLGTHHGNEAISQIAVDDRFGFVFTFKDDRIIREQGLPNREEALEAAGL